ncbi:MAG: hypothetical protein RLZZ271_1636 [Pseudomonadota bacterium]
MLGLGRALGTDRPTMHALRRSFGRGDEEGFPQDVMELQRYLANPRPGQPEDVVRALPGQGTEVPIWLLGSSTYSAQLAAHLGLPFAFASHFAPDLLEQALDIYRATYQPSEAHPRPHAMVAVNVVAADTDEEALRLFTSMQQRFLGIVRGRRGPLPQPVDNMDALWSPAERAQVERMLAVSVVGDRERVKSGLQALQAHTSADELIVAGAIHDSAAMCQSIELTTRCVQACAKRFCDTPKIRFLLNDGLSLDMIPDGNLTFVAVPVSSRYIM